MINNYLDMYIKGDSIQSILLSIKASMNCQVFILDKLLVVTHHTYERKAIPKLLEVLPSFVKGLKNVPYIFHTHHSYTSYPLVFSNETLGWLCIEHTQEQIINTHDATQTLAIMIANDKKFYDLETSLKGELVDALLNLEDTKLYNFQEKFKVYFDSLYCVVLIQIDTPKKDIINNYYQITRECLKHVSPKSLPLVRASEIIIVLDKTTLEDLSHILIQQFVNKANLLNAKGIVTASYKIGVSHDYVSIHEFKTGYHEAFRAIKFSSTVISYYKDLEIKHFLFNTPKEERKHFVERYLGPLKHYKKPHHVEFLETLETYIKTNRNWTETKKRLNIHGNTLTYRLQRISEILDIDLKNYGQVFKIQIALEIDSVDYTK